MPEIQRKKKLKDPYKIVLLREETLQEVGSYRLTLLNVYILISVILIITAAIAIALIFFTPIKRLVPGYADPENNPQYVALVDKLEDLEGQIASQQLYIERFRALISSVPGDTAVITAAAPDQTYTQDSLFLLPPIQAVGITPSEPVQEVSAPVASLFFVAPLKGQVSAPFDEEANHFGIDILAPLNTPVKAILDGHVISSDWTLETGNTIAIQHANSVVSFYKHNARNLKSLGEMVKAGEAVAIVGNTGEISSGPHLHFELWIDGQPEDPAEYIDFNP